MATEKTGPAAADTGAQTPEAEAQETTGAGASPLAAETKESRASETIRNYALGAAGAGFAIPFPLGDILVISGIQLKMLHSISRIYGFRFSENMGKSLIASLLGGGVTDGIGRGILASMAKSIPVIGSLAGALSLPVFAGASTYAVGKVFVQHFESGGTFLDFDPDKVKAYFARYYEEGKTVVAGARK